MKQENKIKATIYYAGSFLGTINNVECKLIQHGHTKYAQYDNAVQIDFIPRGKRNTRRLCEGYNPFFLILEGWGLPNPEDGFITSKSETGSTIRTSKYSSFDDRFKTDFNALINPVLHEFKVIADYRHTTEEHKEDQELKEYNGFKVGERVGLALDRDNYVYGELKKIIEKASGVRQVEILNEETNQIETHGVGFLMAKGCL